MIKLGLITILTLPQLLGTVAHSGEGQQNLAEIEQLFKSHQVEGTLVVSSLRQGWTKVHNRERAETRYSPASTYKILNTLIGLKNKVVKPDEFVFKWDGQDRRLAAWNKDHSLASAFKVSCVWCYQSIAREIGVANYRQELSAVAFGNQLVDDPVELHWLNGVLTISANEQIDFLMRLVDSGLPYDKQHMDALKNIMLVEKHSNYALYAKSGWTGPEISIGWYVGYIETRSDTLVFAMNMTMHRVEQASLRKELVIKALKALKII